jgi:glutathione S-transferase
MITVYAFSTLPPPVVGVTRDLRVFWALEEAGLAYRVHPLDHARGDLRGPDYLKVNPFGLVPAIEDEGHTLFESAAILHYIAEKAGKLWPRDARGRVLATQWMFAAADTVEPKLRELFAIDKLHSAQAWARERRPMVVELVQKRLVALDAELAQRRYVLGDEFAVPDILLSTALRQIHHTDLLEAVPHVAAYKERCESRPAWRKIYAAYEQRLAA